MRKDKGGRPKTDLKKKIEAYLKKIDELRTNDRESRGVQ